MLPCLSVVVVYDFLETPIGALLLVADEEGLREIRFPGELDRSPAQDDWQRDGGALHAARVQLESYFKGSLTRFDLPLAPRGTPFQHQVWRALREIPYGETRSYGDIAVKLGKPTASRAVGAANGRNPLPIVVPCHRVIGADGSLTGFGGGMAAKAFLLDLEGIRLAGPTPEQESFAF